MNGAPRLVTAKTRKRCPHCREMIEVGASAVLTDDRYMEARIQWHGRKFQRGAWHLWHPDCHKAARGADLLLTRKGEDK